MNNSFSWNMTSNFLVVIVLVFSGTIAYANQPAQQIFLNIDIFLGVEFAALFVALAVYLGYQYDRGTQALVNIEWTKTRYEFKKAKHKFELTISWLEKGIWLAEKLSLGLTFVGILNVAVSLASLAANANTEGMTINISTVIASTVPGLGLSMSSSICGQGLVFIGNILVRKLEESYDYLNIQMDNRNQLQKNEDRQSNEDTSESHSMNHLICMPNSNANNSDI
jgi:hypothetical protein